MEELNRFWKYWKSPATPEMVATYNRCAWCNGVIGNTTFDRHHWLIKRGALPRRFYDIINVLINVVPLHHSCHMAHGQSPQMKVKCLDFVGKIAGAEAVQVWYDEIMAMSHLPKEILYGDQRNSAQQRLGSGEVLASPLLQKPGK